LKRIRRISSGSGEKSGPAKGVPLGVRKNWNDTRRILYKIEHDVTVELIGLLLKNADGDSSVPELLRVPRMRQHVASSERQLARLGFTVDGRRRSDAPTTRPPSRDALARYDHKGLYEEVWSEPTQTVARRYGISDVALSKVCKQLQVPKPPRGYRAKKGAGHRVPPRPRLPALVIPPGVK
jgi:hypothetical protein